MLKSMTGYGRAQKVLNGRDILVEIHSVNHRYFEYSSRVPRSYSYIDDKLKALLKDSISRGKTEVSVTINNIEGKDAVIALNKGIAEGYISALRGAAAGLGLKDDLTLSNLMKLPDIFNVQKNADDEDEVWSDVCEVAQEAVSAFVEMRKVEGEKLRADLTSRLKTILGMVAEIEKLSPMTVESYKDRLYQKLSEILEDKNIDEQRILTEAAIFADKIAVDEETVRLRSHIDQFMTMLGSGEPVGRKLDFIVQEMNRETNTIGSKAQNLDITKNVLAIKAEIEKIREQVQNVE